MYSIRAGSRDTVSTQGTQRGFMGKLMFELNLLKDDRIWTYRIGTHEYFMTREVLVQRLLVTSWSTFKTMFGRRKDL